MNKPKPFLVSKETWRGCLGGNNSKSIFHLFVKISLDRDVSSLTTYYEKLLKEKARHEGLLHAVKYMKSLYDVALRYCSDLQFDPIPFTKSYSSGFPKVLGPFRELLEGSTDDKRAALSVLQLYKLVDIKGTASLKSITDDFNGDPNPRWLRCFKTILEKEFPPSKLEERRMSLKGKFHISGKNGPNGPALMTSHIDLWSVSKCHLLDYAKSLASLTNNERLLTIIESGNSILSEEVSNKRGREPCHSRLRVKHEPGGKARIFAIGDIISQSALSPIHSFFMKWLGNQRTDGARSHSDAAHAVREWTKSRLPIFSFDLTTATDRYPVFLQHLVVEYALGKDIADLWRDLISDREFVTPDGKSKVKFNCGQPLGLLSSWAVFATTHHLHIRTAARLKRRFHFKDYRIIGDDISIFKSRSIANRYIRMMRDLDVPFSPAKSIIPSQVKSGNVAELAKRLFRDGDEITPIPPNAILEYMADPIGLRQLLEIAHQRGYSRMRNPYPVQSLITERNKRVRHSRSRYELDFASLTFPLGRQCPPLKGVTQVLQHWDPNDTDTPPGGLVPGWAYWRLSPYWEIPSYGFGWLLKSFLTKEINNAIEQAEALREFLYGAAWDGSLSNQGGDWKPGIADNSNLASYIISSMSEQYGDALYQVQEDLQIEDLYTVLGKLHSIVKPDDLFGRKRFLDEKSKTRIYAIKLVKLCRRIRREGIESFLNEINE